MSDRLAAYHEFLRAKVRVAEDAGFEINPDEINPELKPFVRDIVRWSLIGGRRAVFASFGLHKTSAQIEIMRLLASRGDGLRLIVMPLGVPQEFRRDAGLYFHDDYAVKLKFIRKVSEVEDERTIYLTNYESIREGVLDVAPFTKTSLDEAAVLRSFGSETFGQFLFGPMQAAPYRFVATATPSPNQYLELIAYAHYLGVMDMGEAKTRFFKRDSEHADRLTLHPHKEEEFWLWVASWALFITKPSDLGYSDDGYDLPELDVRWHELPSAAAITAGDSKRRQGTLIRSARIGVSDAAKEKRVSLGQRVQRLLEIREEEPDAHRIIWHDLEDERKAVEKAVPGVVSVYGAQRGTDQGRTRLEQSILGFADGEIQEIAAKPVMLGAGVNFQRHCSRAVYLGIGFKFNDFIQSVHRLQRFQQPERVRIDLIYTEAERDVRAQLEAKWERHKVLVARMTEIVRKYGLSQAAIAGALTRGMGTQRQEAAGDSWRLTCNDSVEETMAMAEDSVDLVLTSIPFSTQYEYTPSLNDFGHTDDSEHFYEQMGFLTPELLRVLRPGRVCCVHVKDRVVPGAITGHGYQTVDPFHADCIAHFRRHGFTYGGMITVVTDVVRENNQTYRLGWSENCKDGSRMGAGLPEYVLLFRKPPTDSSNGYADEPVVKSKAEYSRARWQVDANGLWRSSGDRALEPADFIGLNRKEIWRLFETHSLDSAYDFEGDVAIGEQLEGAGALPTDFNLIPPRSWHPDVWTDVMRARGLNSLQGLRGREKHVCPLPFDIVDRLINRFSMEGDVVYDPFSGIGTVPRQAIKAGRQGLGCELNPGYWADSVSFCRGVVTDTTACLFTELEIGAMTQEVA